VRQTLEKYRARIRKGEVNPLVHWDGKKSGMIFDPERDDVPLSMLGFGACRIDAAGFKLSTREREIAFVPIEGEFEFRIGPEQFKCRREGGPFATLPNSTNAYAIYAPADSTVEIKGNGEVVYFTAPAVGHKPPAMVKPGDRDNVVRGTCVWRRKVVTLFTPEDVTTVLVGGETYSPPGLWSGQPLHVHDVDDPQHGQSDHEEVYYHLARCTDGQWGPYGVQMLFDDKGLDNAYVIHNRSAFAIPGAAHPVVSCPNSEMLYVWALAGIGPALYMLDIPEFAYLKKVGELLDKLIQDRPRNPVAQADWQRVISSAGLSQDQARILRMYLKQQGVEVSD